MAGTTSRDIVLREPAQLKCAWAFHKSHLCRNLQGIGRTRMRPPRLNTGLWHLRGNLSVWPRCLGKKETWLQNASTCRVRALPSIGQRFWAKEFVRNSSLFIGINIRKQRLLHCIANRGYCKYWNIAAMGLCGEDFWPIFAHLPGNQRGLAGRWHQPCLVKRTAWSGKRISQRQQCIPGYQKRMSGFKAKQTSSPGPCAQQTKLCKVEVMTCAEFPPMLTGLVAELTFVRPRVSMVWISRASHAFVSAGLHVPCHKISSCGSTVWR